MAGAVKQFLSGGRRKQTNKERIKERGKGFTPKRPARVINGKLTIFMSERRRWASPPTSSLSYLRTLSRFLLLLSFSFSLLHPLLLLSPNGRSDRAPPSSLKSQLPFLVRLLNETIRRSARVCTKIKASINGREREREKKKGNNIEERKKNMAAQ